MGYCADIVDYHLRFTDAKQAHQILRDNGFEGTTLEDCFMNEMFDDFEVDKDGNVTLLGFCAKYRDQDAMFHHLAHLIAAPTNTFKDEPAFIEWVGEDNYRWRFVFIDGAMQEVDAITEWTYLNEERTSDITVQPFTLDSDSGKDELVELLSTHISHLESQQDTNSELIREEKMTLKAVQDAKRVILTIEAIDE